MDLLVLISIECVPIIITAGPFLVFLTKSTLKSTRDLLHHFSLGLTKVASRPHPRSPRVDLRLRAEQSGDGRARAFRAFRPRYPSGSADGQPSRRSIWMRTAAPLEPRRGASLLPPSSPKAVRTTRPDARGAAEARIPGACRDEIHATWSCRDDGHAPPHVSARLSVCMVWM
jgi:hypothetical protein